MRPHSPPQPVSPPAVSPPTSAVHRRALTVAVVPLPRTRAGLAAPASRRRHAWPASASVREMKCPPTTTRPSPSMDRLPQHLPLTRTASTRIACTRAAPARRHSQHIPYGLPSMPPHRPFKARGRPLLRVAPWERVRMHLYMHLCMHLCMHLQPCVRALLERAATMTGRTRRALTSACRRTSGLGRTSRHDRIARPAMQRASLPSVWPHRTCAPQQRTDERRLWNS